MVKRLEHRAQPQHPQRIGLADPGVRAIVQLRLQLWIELGVLLSIVPALRTPRPDATIALVTWAEIASIVARVDTWVHEIIGFPG